MEQYLVLARKYRPNLFSDIVGQPHIVQTLKNALRNKRLGHSFLFSGPRGIGKTTTARILAKALNCVDGPREEPCNECEQCHEITAGSSLDVFEIDGASNNSVEDIRLIRERVQYSPTKSRYKIYIIDEVHMLSNSAFNALLKTLEEPPAHVIFMFATTEVHKIPITIISRCQHYELKLLSVSEIIASCQKILESEKIEFSTNALRMIARAAEGSLRDAQSLLDQVINLSGQKISINDVRFALGSGDPELLNSLLTAIMSGSLEDALIIIDQFASTGYDLYQLSKDLISVLRNLLIVNLVSKPHEILDLSEGEMKELKEIARNSSLDHIEYALFTLCDLENTIKWATYPRFLLETTVSKITRYADLVPLTTILEQIDKMKQTFLENGLAQVTSSSPPSGPTHRDTENVDNSAPEPAASYNGQDNGRTLLQNENKPSIGEKPEKRESEVKNEHDGLNQERESGPVERDRSFESQTDEKAGNGHEMKETGPADDDQHPLEAEGYDPAFDGQSDSTAELSPDSSVAAPTSRPDQAESIAEPEAMVITAEPEKTKSVKEADRVEIPEDQLQPDEAADTKQAGQEDTSLVREIPLLDFSHITQIWLDVVKRISVKKQSLATILENCYLISCDRDEMKLGIKKEDELSRKILEDRNNQAMILMTFANLAGFRPKLELVLFDKSHQGFSIQDDNKNREEERYEELRKIALKKPHIQQTLDLFDGTISSIIEQNNSEEGEDE